MPPKLARPPKKGTKADLEAKAKKVRKLFVQTNSFLTRVALSTYNYIDY